VNEKIESIDMVIRDLQAQMQNLADRVKENDIESFDRYVSRSINTLFEKVQELEQMNKNMQNNYIQRLSKLLETRKQAEINFLEERRKFASVVKDVEMAYQRKNEAFEARLKKELLLTKAAYDKLKDENGKRTM